LYREITEDSPSYTASVQFKDDFEYYSEFIHLGRECKESERNDGCISEASYNAKNQTQIYGKSICGKPGSATYLSLDRPADTDASICEKSEEICAYDHVKGGDKCPYPN